MPDIASLANTIAGTRAQVPKMDFGGGGSGGGGNRGMIQESVNPGEATGKAIGTLASIFFGKKLQEREKEIQAGVKIAGETLDNVGFTGTKPQLKKYLTEAMKINKDAADMVTEQYAVKYKPDETGIMRITPSQQQQAENTAYGGAVGIEKGEAQFFKPRLERATETATATATATEKAKFAQEKIEQPTRLEWAKQEESTKQDIIFDREKKNAALEDSYKSIDEARQIKLGIEEENRKRKTPEGKLALENAEKELKYRELSNDKMTKEIQVMENNALQQNQEDFAKDIDSINKYLEDNFPTLIDKKTKKLKPVKNGSEEQIVIRKVFAQFGHTAQFNIVKDKTFGTDVVAPFVLSPKGELLESNIVKSKAKEIKLTPEQQKQFDIMKNKPGLENLTEEIFLDEISKGKQATNPKIKKEESKPPLIELNERGKRVKTAAEILYRTIGQWSK